MAIYSLTTGTDTIPGTTGDDTVNASSSTLNTDDSLTGDTGADTLVLSGGGTFRIDQLASFTGFENIVLNNASSSGAEVYLGAEPVNVTFNGSSAAYNTLRLGSGATTFHAGDNSLNQIYVDSQSSWSAANTIDATASASLIIQFFANNATYDLTTNTFANIDILYGYGTDQTFKISSAVATRVANFQDTSPGGRLTTSDATLDLSQSTVDGFKVVSTNAAGTTFTVKDVATALQIDGGIGTDKIVASGFTFTQAERDALFGNGSIELLQDSTGIYTTPYPPVAAFLVGDTGASSTDHITATPDIAGKGDPNAVVRIQVDGGPEQTVIADASGEWTFSPTGLSNGPHTISARETNVGGYTRIASVTFTLDAENPTIASFDAVDATLTNAMALQYSVTFSEDVAGVDVTSFDLNITGGVSGASVVSVMAIDASHYIVTVDAGTGEGTITLGVNGSGIVDTAGNPVSETPVSGPAYTIDRTVAVSNVVDQTLVEATAETAGTDTATATITRDADTSYTNLGSFGWSTDDGIHYTQVSTYGTATLDISTDTVTFALDNAAADVLNSADHPVQTFTVQVVDTAGNVAPTEVSFDIDGANDAPVNTIADQVADEDAGSPIIGLSVSDADIGTGHITVTLTVQHGVLHVREDVPGGLNALDITGNDTASVTLSCDPSLVNATLAALNGVVYLADTDYNGSDSLEMVSDDGGGQTDTDTVTIDIHPTNDAPTGAVTITGNATEDEVLTADTSTLADTDGLGTLHYQWQRNGVNVGSDQDTYTLGDADVGAVIQVVVSYTDSLGKAESITSDPTAAVTNVNDDPTSAVTITGTVAENQTLTADTSALADHDGLGTFHYQWLRDGANVGADQATYALGDVDVGGVIQVVVSYTDGQGTLETVTSAATAQVANVNDAPNGVVTVTGTTTEDETLTADTSTLSDIDGLGTLHYQWQRDGVNVGADQDTYILGDADVGAEIRVMVSYTDGQGTLETLTSAATAIIANVNDAPIGDITITGDATENETLTADISALADLDDLGTLHYQWQRDGVNVGADQTTYTLGDADVGGVMQVIVSYTDGHGTVEHVTSAATGAVANVNDAPTGAVTITGTVAENQILTANTSALADIDGLGTLHYQWQRDGQDVGADQATYTLGDDDVGAVIRVVVSYTDGQATDEMLTSAGTAAVAGVNDPPTGSVAIMGTAAEDETLTADISTLADIDGLGTLHYQWQRNGVNVGFDQDNYTLADADVGAAIRVVVSYTDGQGNVETLNSSATSLVTGVNDDPIGTVTITGNATEDQSLTANISALVDADGLGTLHYQWQRDGANVGSDQATYTLGDADVGALIQVVVSYTDGQGTTESVTSVPTDTVSSVNDAPTGVVTITGTATEDQALTANTSALADADGIGELHYQWRRNGADVGYDQDTYTLDDADVGAVIRVVVSYTDSQGTVETLTSAATVPVTNVNYAPIGGVAISGSAAEDETLTADISGLTDADGLGTLHYQWQRNGVNVGFDQDSYTLDDADVGATIQVTVSYADAHGTAESVTSAPTDTVSSVNDEPAGGVIITGTVMENQTLTANISALADIDGLGALHYQWQRDGVNVGFDQATYTLGDTDVGASMQVLVSYTDGQGTLETVASAATAAVANFNEAPVLAANLGLTLNEGVTATITAAQLDFDDVDTADTALTYTVTSAATNGTLFRNNIALALNGTFTQDDINSGRISFTHNGGETTSAAFGFSVSDGAGGNLTNQTFNFTVTPVNDAPVNTLPGTMTATSGIDFAVTGLAVSDPDSPQLVTTLHVDNGTLRIGAIGGAAISGSGTKTVTLTGSVAQINAALSASNNVIYRGAGNFNGTDLLTMSSDDGNGGTGGSGLQTVGINVLSGLFSTGDDTVTLPGAGTYFALGGNDVITMLATDEIVHGGLGNDTYQIEATGTTVVELADEGIDTVRTAALGSYVLGANVENLTHTGSNGFVGIGNVLNNVLIGGTGDDYLVGFEGNDTLIDGSGLNTLQGGKGDDIYAVQSLADTVFEFADEGIDEVQTFLAYYALSQNVENLIHIGNSASVGVGNNLNNLLIGGTGNDHLTGGAGDDTLRGGAGTDTAAYSGARASYAITYNAASQTASVTDLRAGSSDGTDLLKNVENLQFSDGAFASSSFASQTVSRIVTRAPDFNGDGTTDLVFVNNTSHVVAGWGVVDGQITSAGVLGTLAAGAHFEKSVDFNADGRTDLLVLNDTTRDVSIWQMNGTQPAVSTTVGNINFAGGWRFTDVGDFNGDGKSDLMFQNTFTHDVAVWQMDGSHLAAASVAGNINTAGGWQYTAVGDFNGDGKSDLLFVNSITHDVAAWTMNGGQIQSAAVLGNINAAGGWRFQDVGDFNADGNTDLLFINDNTHGVALWQTDGKQVLAAAQVGTIDAGWHFADAGDFNGDRKSDLLLINDTTHGVAVWQMNGTSATSAKPIGFANATDAYAGLQDFNGDRKSDVLFQNTTTGEITAWEMNGIQIASIHKVGTINVAADYHLVT